MVVKLYREASGDEPHLPDPFTVDTAALMPGHELVLRYSDPDSRFGGDRDGRFGRLLLIVLMGAFAAGLLLLLVGGALLSLVLRVVNSFTSGWLR